MSPHPDLAAAPRAPHRGVGSQAERVLRLALRLLREPSTARELAAMEDVHPRTIRRDLEVIGRVCTVRRHGECIRVEGT